MSWFLVFMGVGLLTGSAMGSCGKMSNPSEFRCAAREELTRAKNLRPNTNVAKNLVVFIGDGMGVPTITAARILQGQMKGMSGEEYKLFFETFPSVGLSKTYNADRQVADSAGTATAMFSGVKTNYGTLGVNNLVPFGKNCVKMTAGRKVKTIIDHGLEAGKSVGLVTTARITHATPAAAYAHLPYRYWESDTDMGTFPGCDNVKDIARQLIEDNPNINVILGGGRRSFINNTTPDPQTGKINSHQRADGKSLIEEWKADKKSRGKRYKYVDTKGQMDDVDADTTDYLFGLFQSSHMTYETERDSSPSGEPSLSEMTSKAIEILKKNPKGFVLMVEGARIDHAHHMNEAKRALVEVGEFDKAVSAAQTITGTSDTLTIVTADHSHVFSVAGYPTRGNDILGLVDRIEDGEEPTDNLPYLTLTYANGPKTGRTNLTGVDTSKSTYRFPACVNMPWETHGGEDVSIYAIGPMSHLFHTTHEQNYIAHVGMYAGCFGEYKSSCDRSERDATTGNSGHIGVERLGGHLFLIFCIFIRLWLL